MFRRQRRLPGGVDQAHVQQIAKVHAVLVSERIQFHLHQSRQRQHVVVIGVFDFADICRREGARRVEQR